MEKNVLFLLIISMTVVGFGGSTEAEVFVSENFEDGAFDPPYQFLCGPNDPGTPPQTGPCTNTAEHVTAEKRSGNYSLECVFNMAQAAGLRIFPADYGHADFGNKTYIRFYMKWDPDFRFYNRHKVFRWHVPGDDIYLNTNACGADGVVWKDGWWQGFTSCSRYGELTFVRTNQPGKFTVTNEVGNSDWVVEAGTGWYMFEFFYDASTTNFALWVMRPSDEVSTQVINQYYGGSTSSEGNGVIDINWINSVSDGSGGKMWIDEIVVADHYIGPINATDTTPPVRFNPQPTGTLASGTTSATISLTTNIQAICRYSNVSGTNYTNMTDTFTNTNSTNHSTLVTGLENGQTYTYFIRCNSSDGFVNTDEFNIIFSVDGHKADINDDGVINMPELMVFIARWKLNDGVTKVEVLDARDIWFTGGVY